MRESATLEVLRSDNPARAQYVDTLVDRVREGAWDGGERAQVAALVVRGIVDVDVEWMALVEVFGLPSQDDWGKALVAYGSEWTGPFDRARDRAAEIMLAANRGDRRAVRTLR